MTKYRHQLPQLTGDLFLSDGGIETTLIFHNGLDLPLFAAFPLLQHDEGIATLRTYFATYANLARQYNTGFILESATWRASADWGQKLGYSAADLADLNRKAIALLEEVRNQYETVQTPMVISGCIGPRGDGYNPTLQMTADEATAFHLAQAQTFRHTAADMISAITMVACVVIASIKQMEGESMKQWRSSSSRKRIWLCASLLLLVCAVKPVLAHGEGRTLQQGHVPVGAYYLTIWTAPAILRTGEVHLDLSLLDHSGHPAPTAQIYVTLTPLERQAPPLSALAQTVAGVPGGLRTALFTVQQPGRYQVTVTVTDTQGNGGTVEFVVAITQLPGVAKFVIYSQLLLALGAGGWLLNKGADIWFGRSKGIYRK